MALVIVHGVYNMLAQLSQTGRKTIISVNGTVQYNGQRYDSGVGQTYLRRCLTKLKYGNVETIARAREKNICNTRQLDPKCI